MVKEDGVYSTEVAAALQVRAMPPSPCNEVSWGLNRFCLRSVLLERVMTAITAG